MLIYHALFRVDNPSINTAAGPAAKVEGTKDKAPSEGVEESLPEGILDILSAYMCSLYAELVVVVKVLPHSILYKTYLVYPT